MPKTPNCVFRLPSEERASLDEMAKIFGAANTSAFLREMVGAMCSGKTERVAEFNAKLIRAAGEQLILKLNAPLGPVALPEASKVLSLPVKRKKKRRRRQRAT